MDDTDDNYDTALHIACSRGFLGVVRMLLENGASVNIESGSYGSAIQAASEEGASRDSRTIVIGRSKPGPGL